MDCLKLEHLDGNIARLTLASGRGNPITPDMIEALQTTLHTLQSAPPKVLVLGAGESSIFSGGFDLPTIAHWDRPKIKAFFTSFLKVLDQLMLLPCPVIGAVGGHAIAGGFILSLACDIRIVKKGGLKLGLSEVDLGVGVPAGTQLLFAARTAGQTAYHHGMTGKLFGPEEALSMGYAMELADDANSAAMAMAEALAAKPGHGPAVTKALWSPELAEAVREADTQGLDTFLDSWFSEAAQAGIQGMAAKLSAR